MYDFLIALAFVLMVVGPAIVATRQAVKSHDPDSDAETAVDSNGD